MTSFFHARKSTATPLLTPQSTRSIKAGPRSGGMDRNSTGTLRTLGTMDSTVSNGRRESNAHAQPFSRGNTRHQSEFGALVANSTTYKYNREYDQKIEEEFSEAVPSHLFMEPVAQRSASVGTYQRS